MTINADKVLEIDDSLIPTGKLRDVAGTPMDFRAPATIGSRIDQDYDLLKRGRGYDHAYAIKRSAEAGAAAGDGSRAGQRPGDVGLEHRAERPVLQANSLTGKGPRDVGKGNTPYIARSAFCIEPQHFPDSPNHPEFPSTVLKRGAWYNGQIIYRFSTRS